MIKKFFKAVIMGVRNSEKVMICGAVLVSYGWLPMLLALIWKVFKINVSSDTMLLILLLAIFGGAQIAIFAYHCVEAMKYQERNQCDFHEAWEATSIIEYDDTY